MPSAARSARALLVVALMLCATSLTACRRVRAPWKRHRAVSAKVVRGRAHYLRYCALCHGRRAEGYAADHANALGNRDFLAVASDAFLRDAVTHGRPGTPMSAWGQAHGGPLDAKAVDDIVAYLRSLARRRPARLDESPLDADTAAAAVVWAERCVECHGARGQGSDRATSVSHPNFLRAVSDGYLRETIRGGRHGTQMASYAALPARTVDGLVAHIRGMSFEPGPPPPPEYEPPPTLDRLIINPGGRRPSFTLREGRYVPAAAVLRALQESRRMVILDTRATSDWSRGHITGALPFPFYDIEEMASRLPRDGTWILAYCACPHAASGHVVDELRRRGFPRTAVIDEGITYWMNQGYPTARAAIVSPSGTGAAGAATAHP